MYMFWLSIALMSTIQKISELLGAALKIMWLGLTIAVWRYFHNGGLQEIIRWVSEYMSKFSY